MVDLKSTIWWKSYCVSSFGHVWIQETESAWTLRIRRIWIVNSSPLARITPWADPCNNSHPYLLNFCCTNDQKSWLASTEPTDVLHLNVGGAKKAGSRQTLTSREFVAKLPFLLLLHLNVAHQPFSFSKSCTARWRAGCFSSIEHILFLPTPFDVCTIKPGNEQISSVLQLLQSSFLARVVVIILLYFDTKPRNEFSKLKSQATGSCGIQLDGLTHHCCMQKYSARNSASLRLSTHWHHG
jgi:hypothetical protein